MRTALRAVLVAAGAATWCGSASGTAPLGSQPPAWVVAQVRGSIARLEDPHPTSAVFVLTRRQDANEALDGAGVNSNQLVYAVVVKGRFTVDRPGPNASGRMHVPVVFYVLDARTGRETDGGFGRSLPDLSKLGTVHDLLPYLLRRSPAGIGTFATKR